MRTFEAVTFGSACTMPAKWRARHLAIVAVIGLAGLLRFSGITEVGVRFDDEAAYAHDARLWSRGARVAVDTQAIRALIRGDKEVLRSRIDAIGVDFEERYLKPSQGYTMLGAAAMLICGDRPSSLAMLNATLGTLSVFFLWLIGSAWLGPRVGLLAALLYAVSPYDINYSRSLWAESSCSFFTLLGLWFWTRAHSTPTRFVRTYSVAQADACGSVEQKDKHASSQSTDYFLCGLALGYAITCHYRCAVAFVPLLIVDGLERVSLRHAGMHPPQSPLGKGGGISRSTWLCSWVALGVGAILPALVIEGAFQLASLGAWVVGGELPFPTFVGGYIEWGRIVSAVGLTGGESRFFYPQVVQTLGACFVHWQGWACVGLGLIGLPFAWRAKGLARFAVLSPLILIGLLCLQRHAVARSFVPTIPLFCLVAGLAIIRIAYWARRTGMPPLLSISVLTIIISLTTVAPLALARAPRNDLARACAYLDARDGLIVLPPDTSVRSKYHLYLDTEPTRTMHARLYRLGTPGEVMTALRNLEARWIVVDPQVWLLRDLERFPSDPIFRWWTDFESLLQEHASLVTQFDHLQDHRWEFLVEGPGVAMLDEMRARHDGPIRIYRLEPAIPTDGDGDEALTRR